MIDFQKIRQGKSLVFTNGVFDILHVGHVTYLEQARALGDILVVGVNSDASVKGLGKGPDRPINNLADRMKVLQALRSVDFVVSFDEATPERLIAQIRPDIHAKGGDYKASELPETAVVEGYGGCVVILPFVAGHSTTRTIRKMTSEALD